MLYQTQHKITKHLLDEIFEGDDIFVIREIVNELISNMSREDIIALFNITKTEQPENERYFDHRYDEINYKASIDVEQLLSRGWVKYNWEHLETRPTKYGKYFIMRKDGKIHWETWNGTGFAYNNSSIIYWREIKKPIIKNYEKED